MLPQVCVCVCVCARARVTLYTWCILNYNNYVLIVVLLNNVTCTRVQLYNNHKADYVISFNCLSSAAKTVLIKMCVVKRKCLAIFLLL